MLIFKRSHSHRIESGVVKRKLREEEKRKKYRKRNDRHRQELTEFCCAELMLSGNLENSEECVATEVGQEVTGQITDSSGACLWQAQT